VEVISVAKGIEVSDAMLKAADVEVLMSSSTCPGKYIVLVRGEVAAVSSSVEAGKKIAADTLIDDMVIANVHPQIFPAMSATTAIDNIKAIGMIETYSVASCILAADQAVKSADVTLIELRLARALCGKSFVLMTGEVAAVKSAIDAGINRVKGQGLVMSSTVIPSPHKDLLQFLL